MVADPEGATENSDCIGSQVVASSECRHSFPSRTIALTMVPGKIRCFMRIPLSSLLHSQFRHCVKTERPSASSSFVNYRLTVPIKLRRRAIRPCRSVPHSRRGLNRADRLPLLQTPDQFKGRQTGPL